MRANAWLSALTSSEISERTPKSRRRSFCKVFRAGIALPLSRIVVRRLPHPSVDRICVGNRTLYALIHISGWQPPINEARSLTKAVK
jgi:hypothetical protein